MHFTYTWFKNKRKRSKKHFSYLRSNWQNNGNTNSTRYQWSSISSTPPLKTVELFSFLFSFFLLGRTPFSGVLTIDDKNCLFCKMQWLCKTDQMTSSSPTQRFLFSLLLVRFFFGDLKIEASLVSIPQASCWIFQ